MPFYFWKSIWQHPNPDGSINALGFIADITGYSFWRSGTQTSWFVAAIIMFYLIFPLLYKIVGKVGKWPSLCAILLMYPFIIMTQKAGFSIAVSRFPAFYLGVVMAYYGMIPKVNRPAIILSMLYLIVFVGLFPIKQFILGNGMPPTYLWMFYITMIIPIVDLLYCIFDKTRLGGGNFWSFIGAYSLEIYLIHVMLLNISKWSGLSSFFGYWLYLLIPLITIPLAMLASRTAKLIKI